MSLLKVLLNSATTAVFNFGFFFFYFCALFNFISLFFKLNAANLLCPCIQVHRPVGSSLCLLGAFQCGLIVAKCLFVSFDAACVGKRSNCGRANGFAADALTRQHGVCAILSFLHAMQSKREISYLTLCKFLYATKKRQYLHFLCSHDK